MPRFYFHLRDRMDRLLDPEGVELPDLEAARACALRNAYDVLAGDAGKGKINLTYRIEIEDEAGTVLDTIHFRDIVEIAGLPS